MVRVQTVLLSLVVILVAVVSVTLVAIEEAAPADALVPAGLERWLGTARDAARSQGGLAALVPFRFVEALCSSDGRTAAMAFEPMLGSGRAYAVIGFPQSTPSLGPIDAIAIVGESSDAFAANTALRSQLSAQCDRVLSP